MEDTSSNITATKTDASVGKVIAVASKMGMLAGARNTDAM